MDMGFSHWMALESAMQGEQPRRRFTRATLRRVAAFARPHRRALIAFLVLSVVGRRAHRGHPGARRPGRRRDHRADGERDGCSSWPCSSPWSPCSTPWSGIAERWQSSKIGEGLILDLRRAVFGHVQRMPVAFFTRTRTGALVSRLNNDVIGAQRAFTWTLSGRGQQRHRPRARPSP